MQITLASSLEQIPALDAFLVDVFESFNIDDKEQDRIRLGVNEAVVNAMKHGHKFDESKMVSIVANYVEATKQLLVEVKDQGKGFNPEEVGNPLDPENLLKTSGRGIFFMKTYANDVEYSENGTRLKLFFDLA